MIALCSNQDYQMLDFYLPLKLLFMWFKHLTGFHRLSIHEMPTGGNEPR